jgi:hypothetical protein
MSLFGLQLAKSLTALQAIFYILEAVCGHGTISVDAGPFHAIHVCPMSDVEM